MTRGILFLDRSGKLGVAELSLLDLWPYKIRCGERQF